MMTRKEHWEKIYSEKLPDQVSWFQTEPAKSLELITLAGTPQDGKIIDVGGGASVLVDRLLKSGFKNITVLDISSAALDYAKKRLGHQAKRVNWVVDDVTSFDPSGPFDLWHDRAVFHFFTEEADRRKYVAVLGRALKPGGRLILASFAPDGPNMCSNLTVRQYDAERIQRELGSGFKLIREDAETHVTPWMKDQKFRYFLFARV